VVRLLRLMRSGGYAAVTPRVSGTMAKSPFIDMSSGYFERSRATLPLQGDRAPWRLRQHYFKDARLFSGPVDQKDLVFQSAAALEPAR
jgi:monooxygenase